MSKSIYEKAIEKIDLEFDAWDRAEHLELFELVEQALEQAKKQEKLLEKLAERDTPMLPIKLKWENTENYYYVCPKCEEDVARMDEVFCQDCGQRLLWRYDK